MNRPGDSDWTAQLHSARQVLADTPAAPAWLANAVAAALLVAVDLAPPVEPTPLLPDFFYPH